MNYIKASQILLRKTDFFSVSYNIVRSRTSKHWDPRWKKQRAAKVIKIDLSPFEKRDDEQWSKEHKRTKMKEKGIYPERPWMDKPMYISSTGTVFEQYVPPEGDGKFSVLSKSGAKQNVEKAMKKTTSWKAVRKIRKYEETFNVNEFGEIATNIYVDAHKALLKNDELELSKYVTEKLNPEMRYNIENKTIIWNFIKSLEPARVVYARCAPLLTDTNMFAQVTVRFHTQQSLAVYDRFGRLMHGSEIVPKDVFEYVVLEKHLSNEYGTWRLHAKIIPSWMPPVPNPRKTFVVQQDSDEAATKTATETAVATKSGEASVKASVTTGSAAV